MLAAALVAVSALPAAAGADGEYGLYRKWAGIGSEGLVEMGRSFRSAGGTEMSKALLCYTIVLNRYDDALPDREKSLCAQAFNSAGYIYFYHYCDYAKAYSCFSRAAAISEETGDSLTLMNSCQCLANVFITFAEQNGDHRSEQKGLELYRRSFDIALATRHYDGLISNFINMTSVAFSNGDLGTIDKEMRAFAGVKFPKGVRMAAYATEIYLSMKAIADSDYTTALRHLDRQIAEAGRCEAVQKERVMMNSVFNKAIILKRMGDSKGAVAEMERAAEIVSSPELRDQRANVYNYMADICKDYDPDKARDYRYRYFELRDTLQRENRLQEVAGLHFLDEFQKIDSEMQQMAERRRTERVVVRILAVGIALLVLFLVLLFRKNSRLNKSNRELYRKNVDLLRAEEQARSQRVKYGGSTLTDGGKEKLLTDIREVFDNAEEFCSPDFSLDRLASLVGSKSKYVSQVINELYGQTFTNVLTETRIKEACKRISDVESYGQYTIEAIASGVGFKSRSNFITNFKRITGLTPSAYQKIARSGEE